MVFDGNSNFARYYAIFKNVNLSVDTRLTFVVPQLPQVSLNEEKTTYITFDVYNNGRFIGGTINITSNYEIECNQTGCELKQYLSDLYKRPLYGNRQTLSDVTIRASVVVS